MLDMFKRILAAFLWIWAGSALDGLVSYATGQSISFGLALGVLIALVVTIDPSHVIWARRQSKPVTQEPARA
jgi:hypothetical protein